MQIPSKFWKQFFFTNVAKFPNIHGECDSFPWQVLCWNSWDGQTIDREPDISSPNDLQQGYSGEGLFDGF